MENTTADLKKTRAFLCLECGKCTAVCPISKHNAGYSPRRMVADGLFYNANNIISDKLLWSCLTCQLCTLRCPVDVKYSEYMRDIRTDAHQHDIHGNASHGGALHHIMEITASPKLKQKRTEWIKKDLKVKKKGDYLYFVGCLPYYQDFFAKDFEFTPISIAEDTVRILNHIGIEPVVMADERCCGHDLYWLGQMENFDELAQLNLQYIEKSEATTIITSCPECASALKLLYPERMENFKIQVKHITEIVAENLDKFDFNELEKDVVFQDPCRLGRYLGVYDEPRDALGAITGVNIKEMSHNKQGAICCGTTNWMNCDAISKQIQNTRLKEAKATGAETLVTACPKCQIHFRCSECGEDTDKVDINITDFVNLIASTLKS